MLLPAAGIQARTGSLVVGVESQDYRPYYWTEKGEFRGPVREILDAFAARAGIGFVYEPLPVNRLYEKYLDGELDFKFPDHPLWKQHIKKGRDISYSLPLLRFVDGVMVRPQRKGKGLTGLKVLGTVLGFTPRAYLEQIKQGRIKLSENASLVGLLEQAVMGRIDGAYVNPVVAGYLLKHTLKEPGALVFDAGLPYVKGSYLVSSFKHPGLISNLNRFVQKERELLGGIRLRYGLEGQ